MSNLRLLSYFELAGPRRRCYRRRRSIDDGTVFTAGPFDASRSFADAGPTNGPTMPPQPLEARVERLEERVTKLEELPARMDALSTQISQLREEMQSGFSNVRDGIRAEIRAGDDQVMEHARELYESLKEQIQAGDERVVSEDRRLHEELKTQIQAVDERVMNHARMLYEDLKADLKLIKEGQSPGRRRRPKS
jgi:predicted transport protein